MELAVGALLVFEDAEPRRLRPDAPIELEGIEAAGLAVEVRRHARSFGADKEEVIRAPLSISHAGDPNGRDEFDTVARPSSPPMFIGSGPRTCTITKSDRNANKGRLRAATLARADEKTLPCRRRSGPEAARPGAQGFAASRVAWLAASRHSPATRT
jgi:hypothetical protein